MSQRGTMILLVTAAMLGVAISACEQLPATIVPPDTASQVVVTTRNIIAGEALSPENCRIDDWPVRFLPDSALRSLSELERRVALGPIAENSVVSNSVVGMLVSPIASGARSAPHSSN